MKKYLIFAIVFLLAACSNPAVGKATPSSTSGPTPTLPPLSLTPKTPATGKLITISGNGPFTSQPFAVAGKAFLRVNWRQSCTSQFILSIQNIDKTQAGTPFGEIMFNNAVKPDAMFMDYPFIPGKYVVKVVADGPWTVWVETITMGTVPVQ